MKQFLLLGLGNPGEQFSHTRHNLGIDILNIWIESLRDSGAAIPNWKTQEKFHARVCEVVYGEATITLLSPLVFMNESGKSLAAYLRYHPLERKNILVVHDDLELELGKTRIQESGSAHGHNGMRSVQEYLGDTNISQLRIGVGRPTDGTPIDKFVLATFTPEEKNVLKEKEGEILASISSFVSV